MKQPNKGVPRLVDIHKPDQGYGDKAPSWKALTPKKKERAFDSEVPVEKPQPKSRHTSPKNKIRIGLIIPVFLLLVAGVAGAAYYFRPEENKPDPKTVFSQASLGIEQGIESLRNLNFADAQKRFKLLSAELVSQGDEDSPFSFWRSIDQGWDALNGIQTLLGGYAEFAGVLNDLSGSWPEFFNASSTVEPLPLLERAARVLGVLEGSHKDVLSSLDSSTLLSTGGSLFGSGYDLSRIRNFIESIVVWLKGGERNLAILFLNTSELRPGGGFIGSYAHVRLIGGKVSEVTIHDINEPDRLLEESIIPPQQVRTIVRNWHAADANWWFDFRKSSEKVLEFLEKSEFYQGSSTVKFDGAVGVTPHILQDILAVTGPVKLPKQEITVTSDSVIYEIQRSIQNSREEGENLPKGVLSELYEELGKKWTALPGDKQGELASRFFSWIEKKDLMVYVRDESLASFLDGVNASGRSLTLQENQPHDYLAIVNANLGGNKTDLVMYQKVLLQSQLGVDGSVRNHLELERRHEGGSGNDPWHTATNLSYIRVLTPLNSELESVGGVDQPRVSARTYDRTYSVDNDLAKLESTYETSTISSRVTNLIEDNKRGYAFWVATPKEYVSTTSLDYVRKLPVDLHPGMLYEFTFEKQTGVRGEYEFEIVAPVGYRWRENGLPVFTYSSKDPPARVTFALTLELDK